MKVFVFDLDGVIRHWDPQIVAGAERSHGFPPGVLLGTAFEPGLLLSAITGVITDGAWRTEVVRRLNCVHPEADAAGAVRAWSTPNGELIPGSVEVLDRARRHGTVCLLTNATSRLPDDLKMLGIDHHFDHVFNSSDIGFAKPDQRVFDHVERQIGVQAHEIVFVDDGPANVDAAARRGWMSLLATPATPLAQLVNPLFDTGGSG